MFLDAARERNPALVAFAFEAVRRGLVPPGTFVVDLDTVEANAKAIAAAARQHGIRVFFMSKQLGRQPEALRRIAVHIPAAVAVNLDDARALRASGIPVGHLGHLVQPGLREVEAMLSFEPELVTVFSAELARAVGAAAQRRGCVQDVLLRIRPPDDASLPGQEGGFAPAAAAEVVERLGTVAGIRVVGVTAFPCLEVAHDGLRPTANAHRLRAAAAAMPEGAALNGPGATSVAAMPILSSLGITQAEPGHALTGTTPLHAVRHDLGERPAMVFATEISHRRDADRVAVLGGGFYARGRARQGLVRTASGERLADLEPLPAESIDYYRTLRVEGDAAIGDPVVFAFRFQAFVTRAPIAAVAGLPDRPRVVAIHDPFGHPHLWHGSGTT